MDRKEDSEVPKVFFPWKLLEDEYKDYKECSFLGWEGKKKQYFLVGAYESTRKKELNSCLNLINRESRMSSVTYMKRGLESVEEFKFERKYREKERMCVSLREGSSGKEIKKGLVFMYKNTSFGVESTNLLENLKIDEGLVEEDSQRNSDIGSSLVLATTLKSYMDGILTKGNMEDKKGLTLKDIGSYNRKSSCWSLVKYYTNLLLMTLTYYLSLGSSCCLELLSYGGRTVKFLEKYSKFFELLISKMKMLSEWNNSYKELMNKKEIEEYLELENELKNKAVSLYIDLVMGWVQFFCFRRVFMKYLFSLRSYCKTVYIEKMKSLFFFLATKIFVHLKLNNEVSTSMSKFIVNKIYLWRYINDNLKPTKVVLFKVLEYASLFGLSGTVAFVYDILSLEIVHLIYLYLIMYSIMSYCQKYLYSLLQLFKGKKLNVLKSVLDANQFTKEQLFIGVVFFVVFSLNYPTIWIFYMTIITVLLPILVLKEVILSLVIVLSKFPYYHVITNVFFTRKFTQGVHFRHIFEESEKVREDSELDYLYLEVVPNGKPFMDQMEEIRKGLGERMNQVMPTNILRKVLKCNNIFNK